MSNLIKEHNTVSCVHRILTCLATVEVLASADALSNDHEFLADLVALGVTEVNDGEGSTATGVVDDVL